MLKFAHDIAGGQGNLIATSLQSPDFVTGVSGWQIRRDGSAEFNNHTIRGTFKGTDFEINSSGAFFYSATPAAGNLIASESNTQGDDGFGNYFLKGYVTYVPAAGGGYIASQVADGTLNFWFAANMVSVANPWTDIGNIIAVNGTPNVLQLAPGTGTGDYIGLAGPVKVTGGFHYSGPAVAYHPGGTTDETWQTATPGNGWTATSLKYRMTPANETEVIASGLNGTAETNAVFFQLPAGYRPVSTQISPAFCTSLSYAGQVGVQCNTSGQLSMVATTITNKYDFRIVVSLDF
jgi:hypothetical protein